MTKQWVEDILQESILESRTLSGGDFTNIQLFTNNVRSIVVKTYHNPDAVTSELAGLKMIRQSQSFLTPTIRAFTKNSIMMDYVEPGQPLEVYWRRFAMQLHKMHQQTSDHFGLHQPTFCGSTKQDNTTCKNWASFFLQTRLQALIQQINIDQLTETFNQKKCWIQDQLSRVQEPPALVHGDLWGGNHICDINQRPHLIDPAAYYSHRETDLAMMKLFGGFHTTTFLVYTELQPLKGGWEQREKIYQLYHILHHALILGDHYIKNAYQRMKSLE